MKPPTNRRHKAREWALQMIVQADLNPFAKPEMILEHFWEQQWSCRQEAAGKEDDDLDEMERTLQPGERLASTGVREFTEQLVRGTLGKLDQIDALLVPFCEHWSFDRLGVIERCVLRLAVYEIRELKTPAPVVINEAIELAKYFSNEEAGAFVNGVLDRFAKG